MGKLKVPLAMMPVKNTTSVDQEFSEDSSDEEWSDQNSQSDDEEDTDSDLDSDEDSEEEAELKEKLEAELKDLCAEPSEADLKLLEQYQGGADNYNIFKIFQAQLLSMY